MKFLTLAVLFTVAVLVLAKDGDPCKMNMNCDENECCVKTGWSSKRGNCKPLAKKGDSCNDDHGYEDPYWDHCYCENQMECKAQNVTKTHWGTIYENYRCDTVTTDEPGKETKDTEAPVEDTEAPVEETEAPVEETEAPVEDTEAPQEE